MSKKKILVVEDDVDINRALRIRLESAGFDVCSAQDSLLGVCAAARELPDLILLDITMPAGGGFSVVERVREIEGVEDVPIIFLTASKRADYREMAREVGAAAYFEKPYDWLELRTAIDDALEARENV